MALRFSRRIGALCSWLPKASRSKLLNRPWQISARPAGRHFTRSSGGVVTDANYPYPKAWFAALAARMRGDEAGAQRAFSAARASVAKAVAARPRSASRLSLLAVIDAGLGRKEEAVREARRACDMQPYATDATYAPSLHCNLAVVYAWTDQRDLAIATLAIAVGHPAGENIISQPTYGDFQLNPLWDPLRKDPRFQTFVQKLAQR